MSSIHIEDKSLALPYCNDIICLLLIPLQRIEEPFLSAVSNTLGDRYTQNVEGIYKLTIKFIIETLVAGYESSANNNEDVNNANLSTTGSAAGPTTSGDKKTS